MKNKKGFGRLKHDLSGIYKNHGLKIALFYLVVKIITKLPLLSTILKKASKHKLLVKVRILNNWMYLNLLDPGISYRLIVNGIREQGHVEQIQGVLTSGMKGIDLGANIGYYVLIEGRLIGPAGKIFCIEPGPDNFYMLKKNILENNFGDRTKCFQYLIGDKNGRERLFLSAAANSHTVSAVSNRWVEVPMFTLDQFLASEDINPQEIDFIRMDIEGYEVMAIPNMNKLFTGRKKPLKLFIEVHPSAYEEWGWTLSKFMDYLMGHGFILRSIVKREKNEQGRKIERAVNVTNSEELPEIIKKMDEGKILGNIFLELPANQD